MLSVPWRPAQGELDQERIADLFKISAGQAGDARQVVIVEQRDQRGCVRIEPVERQDRADPGRRRVFAKHVAEGKGERKIEEPVESSLALVGSKPRRLAVERFTQKTEAGPPLVQRAIEARPERQRHVLDRVETVSVGERKPFERAID